MTTNNTAGKTSTSKFTFAAIDADGTDYGNRTSGTMLYSHALIVGQTESDLGVLSWHLTEAAARKAANARYAAATYPVRRIVPVTVTAVHGRPGPGELMPNSDELAIDGKKRLRYAAINVPSDADRQAAYEKAMADDKAAAKAKGEAIAARLNAQAADKGDQAADADPAPAAVRAMFSGLGWSVTAPDVTDVEPVEPIVAVTADGDTAPAEGRPVNKRTRENMAACAAVGLAYWSEHPKPSHVWAVDVDQQPHPVRIDRKRNLAIIAEPNDAIGGNPLRSWSIDADAQAALIGAAETGDAITADKAADAQAAYVAGQVQRGEVSFENAVLGALGDRVIVAHIGSGPVVDALTAEAQPTAVEPVVAQAVAEPVATDDAGDAPATLSATARKARLGDMVEAALGKMIAEMTADDQAALGDAEAVTVQLKAWLRRSGRAFVYKDGHNVTGTDAD